MRNHSKTEALLAIMSVMGATSSVGHSILRDHKLRKGSPEPTDADRNKMKGLKEFHFGENSVWAINQKNADKKAIKLGYLTPTN